MIGIVLNPVSGGGKGEALALRAQDLLEGRGLQGRIYRSCCENGIFRTGRCRCRVSAARPCST